MAENRRGINMRDGKALVNGKAVMDAVKLSLTFTPDNSETRRIGDPTPNNRWLGYKVTGTLEEYRSTPWLREAINEYKKTGATPEFTFQGVVEDENSDYYDDYGQDLVTVTGAVLNGDISLLELDATGDIKKDSVAFTAKSLVE